MATTPRYTQPRHVPRTNSQELKHLTKEPDQLSTAGYATK